MVKSLLQLAWRSLPWSERGNTSNWRRAKSQEPGRPSTRIWQNVPGRSRPRLGVASSWTEERASSACGKLRFAAQRPRAGGMSKDILPFPLSAYPTAAEISLSLEARRAQFGQAEGAEASLDEYIQEAGLEAWTFLVTWALNFVYSGRHGERAERPDSLQIQRRTQTSSSSNHLRFFACPPIYISRRWLKSTCRTASYFS